MSNWFHRWWNPHCPTCEHEKEIGRVCNSCEILKEEVARVRRENETLLNRILEKPESVPERTTAPVPQAVMPNMIPWRVRQQMLESEDRERAKLMRKAPQPDNSVEEMERAMDVASKDRENASK